MVFEQVVLIIIHGDLNALFAKRDFITLRCRLGFPGQDYPLPYPKCQDHLQQPNAVRRNCQTGYQAGVEGTDRETSPRTDTLPPGICWSRPEYHQVTIWEALTNSKPGTHPLSCDPSRLERTPQHKPRPPSSLCSTPSKKQPTTCSYDEQLRIAMEISAREQEEAELRRRQEEEELQRIIQLSLMEK
ncbi:ankyrin repeat domain-containing protein 13B [Lates japonicus]|uniref:Ankyrin repeat domain-containing protein 13B n=1 Tax=Lates japonicus TaxID=270547 RepID=A0AAD3NHK0_LATJO|nr:ankyrin repeat domain-containing protein 13B [Lates japonicus]